MKKRTHTVKAPRSLRHAELAKVRGGDGGITAMDDWEAPVASGTRWSDDWLAPK